MKTSNQVTVFVKILNDKNSLNWI